MRPRRPNGCQVPWIAESSWRSVEWFSPPGHCLKKARKSRGCAESGVGGIGWQYHSRPASASLSQCPRAYRDLIVSTSGRMERLTRQRKENPDRRIQASGVGRRALDKEEPLEPGELERTGSEAGEMVLAVSRTRVLGRGHVIIPPAACDA